MTTQTATDPKATVLATLDRIARELVTMNVGSVRSLHEQRLYGACLMAAELGYGGTSRSGGPFQHADALYNGAVERARRDVGERQ